MRTSRLSSRLARHVGPRAGWELKLAMFHVFPSILLDLHKLDRASREAIGLFVARFEKDGWRLESKPRVRELPYGKPEYAAYDSPDSPTLKVWLPSGPTRYPADHPLRQPGMIDFEVAAWFSHKPEQKKLWLPDEYVSRHGLPAGFRLEE